MDPADVFVEWMTRRVHLAAGRSVKMTLERGFGIHVRRLFARRSGASKRAEPRKSSKPDA
jgi:hypothetical protein